MPGKKGRRSFPGQRMESTGAKRGGGGQYNWGDPMDDYDNMDDIEAWDEDMQEEEMKRRAAEAAAQKQAAKE